MFEISRARVRPVMYVVRRLSVGLRLPSSHKRQPKPRDVG